MACCCCKVVARLQWCWHAIPRPLSAVQKAIKQHRSPVQHQARAREMAAPPFAFDDELAQYCILDVPGFDAFARHDWLLNGISSMREKIVGWEGMDLGAAAADIALVHCDNDYTYRHIATIGHLTLARCSGRCSSSAAVRDTDVAALHDCFHCSLSETPVDCSQRLEPSDAHAVVWTLERSSAPALEPMLGGIMPACNLVIISFARAFANRRVLQILLPQAPQPSPLRPPRAPQVPLACIVVAASARRRMRCSESAFIAARLSTTTACHRRQLPRGGRCFADAIVARVVQGYCRRIQVQRCGGGACGVLLIFSRSARRASNPRC